MRVAVADQTVSQALAMLREAEADFVLLEAEHQSGILLSRQEYHRLATAAHTDFDILSREASAIAQRNWLTEEKLNEMLAEIDAERVR